MPIFSRVRSVWRTLFQGERLDRELDEELRAAVETLSQRYIAAGLDAPSARRQAINALGGLERVKDDVRDARLGAGLDALRLDVRYAWRGLRKSPGFTAVIVTTLALGIGANTAIFSVVHAMLLQPLPYRDADRLVFIWLDRNQSGYVRGPMSGPDLRDLRERTQSFDGLGGIWATGSITLTSDGDPEQIRGAQVTTNFFDVLGVEAAIGRTFRAEDSAQGAEPAILLGWELFTRRYGGDPALVGRTIQVNGTSVRVIGVMPQSFQLLLPPDASVPDHLQAWAPFWPDLEGGPRRNLFLRVIARMKPNVSVTSARDDVSAVARVVSRELGSERTFTVVGLQDDGVRQIRGPLLALFASVGLLLAIACVNVASLLIARAAGRARETAVRLALGASRQRLLGQALVEGLLLTAIGAAAGVAAGYAALRIILALAPESLSRLQAARIDQTVFAFTLSAAVLWGLLFSLAPLTELFKAQPAHCSWDRSVARRVGYRARTALIALQIALSTTLLVSAGLLVRAFVNVVHVDPGFNGRSHLTFRIAVPGESREAFNAFGAELQRRLEAIPGVTGGGAISHIPYDDLPNWALPYSLAQPIPMDAPMADSRAVSPGTLEAMDVRLLDGRFFTAADASPQNPAVIVDDLLARQLWPGRRAIGHTLFLRQGSERFTVVGVVRHVRLRSLVADLSPQLFLPWALAQRNPIAFVLDTSVANPASLTEQVRAAVAGLDARVPIYEPRALSQYIEAARSTQRFTMVLVAAFAVTALALTCVGIYGVVTYTVGHRRHEFGVRRALGAGAREIPAVVLREGFGVAIAGSLFGLGGALLSGRLLESQLYAVHPHDPISYAAAVLLIFAVSLGACLVPALRATAVSPMDALRTE
jgi:putative ABC transport system permease protein